MKQGDFTALATAYKNRPAYSPTVLRTLLRRFEEYPDVVEVGAGTGKLTQQLLELGLSVVAVEPNDAMRNEGIGTTAGEQVEWHQGTGEETGLEDNCADWLLMASAFHWTDPHKSLPEFARLLRTGGSLTLMWNPRYLEGSELQLEIDRMIRKLVPGLQRRSSGAAQHTQHLESLLANSGHFEDIFLCEAQHVEQMTPERYLGAWRSVNDIQAQAGEELWKKIMAEIEAKISGLRQIAVPYKTRAWTARVVK